MKIKSIIVLLVLGSTSLLFSVSNPWGNLKKIHFFDHRQKYNLVQEQLDEINVEMISREEQRRIAVELIRFGDKYLSQNRYELAEAFYQKVLAFSPEYWRLYGRLDVIERERNGIIPNFSLAFQQLGYMLKGFKASFVFVNTLLNMIFFSGMFVFFLYLLILFVKYFKLAANDLLFNANGSMSVKRLILMAVLLLWPVFMLGGWMYYPFLLCGFLWFYINDNERKAVISLLVVIILFSLLYCVNIKLERIVASEKFILAQKVYGGHLYERDVWEKFDSQLKVAQGLAYYENNRYETAMEILSSPPGDAYGDALKFGLMGNIYFRLDNLQESIRYYNNSLQLDDKSSVIINNLTLALLKSSDEALFKENARRYPAIDEVRKQISNFQEIRISPTKFLWYRLLSDNQDSFESGTFIRKVFIEFIKFPPLYFVLILLLYIRGLKRILPVLGDSIYCSKCSKIIKEAAVHRSYKLCEECYQLFSIKDVIFLEAKILKEKELNKRFRKKYILNLFVSIFFPGANFNIKERNNLMVFHAILFYFLLGFAVFGGWVFKSVFTAPPIILNHVGMLAFILYFFINLFSVLGDYDGF